MKELWNTLRLAFYVVALPALATATLAADRFFASDGENQEEIIPVKSAATTFVAQSNRSHSFVRDKEGLLKGVVLRFDPQSGMALGNADAHVVFMRDNKSVLTVKTDENGAFSTNQLLPGPYSVVATSADGFATFGAYVVSSSLEPGAAPIVEIATVPAGSQQVHGILSKPRGEVASLSEMAASMNVDLTTLKMDDDEYEAPTEMIGGANRVQLTADGNLQVRAYPLLWIPGKHPEFNNTTAYLLQNDQVVSQLPVGLTGQALFRSIAPGHYSLVIKGEFGISAQSIEVIPVTSPAAGDTDTQPMAAYQDNPSNEAGVVLAEEAATGGQERVIIREYYFTEAAPFAGGFGGPGVGGGVGGFGGLGGLLETALAAWLLTELIDEIDDNNNGQTIVQQPVIIEPPPPTSPAN